MVLDVETTATVDTKLLALKPMEYVEFHTSLVNLSKVLGNGPGKKWANHIAIVDNNYDVYVLEPTTPGPDALVIGDSAKMLVVDFMIPKGQMNSKGQQMTAPRKQQLAQDAATAKGIFAPRIQVL